MYIYRIWVNHLSEVVLKDFRSGLVSDQSSDSVATCTVSHCFYYGEKWVCVFLTYCISSSASFLTLAMI